MRSHWPPPATEPTAYAVDLFEQALALDPESDAYRKVSTELALELRIRPWQENPLDVGNAPEPPPPADAPDWRLSDWKGQFRARQMRRKLRAALARKVAERCPRSPTSKAYCV
jgi:hypothetical protein